MDIEEQVRGILKTSGIGPGSVNAVWNRKSIRDQILAAIEGDPEIQLTFASLIAVCQETKVIYPEVQRLARKRCSGTASDQHS